MYIIFDLESGQLQIGLRSLHEVNLQHGLIFLNQFKENLSGNIYLKSENMIVLNNQYFIVNNKSTVFKDYRILVNKKIFKKLIEAFFNILFKLRVYKNKFTKGLKWFVLILFTTKFISIGLFFRENPVNSPSSPIWDYDNWVSYFKNSKIANYIAQNKFDIISLEIPNIKGISEFRVIPLNSQSTASNFKAKIALPYNRIISMTRDKHALMKFPYSYCGDQKIYFFEINQDDEILIFNKSDFLGNHHYFTIFQETSMQKNICEEEMHAKHQIEE